MGKPLWDGKSQESIYKFLENLKKIYEGLLEKEEKLTNKQAEKRHHLKQVVEELEEINQRLQIKPYPRAYKPVCEGLNTENRNSNTEPSNKCRELLEFLQNYHDKLHWQYGYKDLPEELQEKFAFGEVLGSLAPITPKKITLGFVLLSPDTNYPRHVHEGVDELYLNIGADCKINNSEVLHGESYHLISGVAHDIRSTKRNMGILLYTWVFPSGSPGKYGMRFI